MSDFLLQVQDGIRRVLETDKLKTELATEIVERAVQVEGIPNYEAVNIVKEFIDLKLVFEEKAIFNSDKTELVVVGGSFKLKAPAKIFVKESSKPSAQDIAGAVDKILTVNDVAQTLLGAFKLNPVNASISIVLGTSDLGGPTTEEVQVATENSKNNFVFGLVLRFLVNNGNTEAEFDNRENEIDVSNNE